MCVCVVCPPLHRVISLETQHQMLLTLLTREPERMMILTTVML